VSAERDRPPVVAAFDFDGTLVPGDSFGPFLYRLLGPRRLGLAVGRAGPPMLRDYRASGRDGAKAALLAVAVAGLDGEAVSAAGEHFATMLVPRVRPGMRRRVDWHRRNGHRLVLVSASLTDYLVPFGHQAGFDDVIATRLERDPAGHLTGRLLGANVRGPEKANRLRALLGPGPAEVWAYGDSDGDRELLAMADHPHLVGRRSHPAPRRRPDRQD